MVNRVRQPQATDNEVQPVVGNVGQRDRPAERPDPQPDPQRWTLGDLRITPGKPGQGHLGEAEIQQVDEAILQNVRGVAVALDEVQGLYRNRRGEKQRGHYHERPDEKPAVATDFTPIATVRPTDVRKKRLERPAGEQGQTVREQPRDIGNKEQILAALWPAAEEDAGFNSVRKVASRLRDALQDQVPGLPKEAILGERDGTYRLNPEFIWSDARSFAMLCTSAPKLPPDDAIAALHEARRLYRGELLADQAYPWISQRQAGLVPRLYYGDRYRQAACRLARLLCEAGQPLRAVELYKALLKNEPTLEDVARGLFRCYQQLGDLASLIREERELR